MPKGRFSEIGKKGGGMLFVYVIFCIFALVIFIVERVWQGL